jgi:hypothetical protein
MAYASRFFVLAAAAAFFTIGSTAPALAGEGDVAELGFDGAIEYVTFDATPFGIERDDAFLIGLPVRSFRAGFIVSEQFELEPSIALSFAHSGPDDATELDFGLSLLRNFRPGGESGPYVRLGAGILAVSDNGSGTQLSTGLGLGEKLPAGDRFAGRLEAAATRNFGNDDFYGSWEFALKFGFSFFTRSSKAGG